MNQNFLRARLLFEQSRFDLAEQQLRLVLVEEPSNAMAHAFLSLCLDERKAYDEATEEAGLAIFHAPDHAIGHYAMACVLESRNRLKEARAAIQEAINLAPDDAVMFARLGSIEASASAWKECLAAAVDGLAVDPDNNQCQNLRAMALTRLGRRDEAGQSIQESLQQDPDNWFTHANEGWRLLHARDPRKAMTHFAESLRLNPNNEWARRGTIEAMKARNPVYRYILMFMLWMNSFSPRIQIVLILGIFFGQGLLQSIVSAVPLLAPFGGLLALAYLLFVWMTWVSSTLFNLVLMADHFGRLVLNRNERTEALLAGGCVLLFAIFLTVVFSVGRVTANIMGSGMIASILFLGAVIPLRTTFSQVAARRVVSGIWTAGVFLVILWANIESAQLPWRLRTLAQNANHAMAEDLLKPKTATPQHTDPDPVNPDGTDDRQSRLTNDTMFKRNYPLLSEAATQNIEQQIKPHIDRASLWRSRGIDGIIYSTWLGLIISTIPLRK